MVKIMDNTDIKIQRKKREIAELTKILDNAKKDLWVLEQRKKEEDRNRR